MDRLISTAGVGFFAASAALFVAGFIAKAGAARSPAEEPSRPSAIMAALAFASALTPLVLVFHAYAVTRDSDDTLRFLLMTIPILAGFSGSLLGAVAGLATRKARIMFRMASIVAGFGALIAALGVALPQIDWSWVASLAGAVGAITH